MASLFLFPQFLIKSYRVKFTSFNANKACIPVYLIQLHVFVCHTCMYCTPLIWNKMLKAVHSSMQISWHSLKFKFHHLNFKLISHLPRLPMTNDAHSYIKILLTFHKLKPWTVTIHFIGPDTFTFLSNTALKCTFRISSSTSP